VTPAVKADIVLAQETIKLTHNRLQMIEEKKGVLGEKATRKVWQGYTRRL
jgi:hypothetical protein